MHTWTVHSPLHAASDADTGEYRRISAADTPHQAFVVGGTACPAVCFTSKPAGEKIILHPADGCVYVFDGRSNAYWQHDVTCLQTHPGVLRVSVPMHLFAVNKAAEQATAEATPRK